MRAGAIWQCMFFFRHPRPVVDPRPVVEQTVRDACVAKATTATLVAPLTSASLPPVQTGAGAIEEAPIRLLVRYRLGEYLSVVLDHLPFAVEQMTGGRKRAGWATRAMLVMVATPAFFYKKWRVGDCRFEIDGRALVRRSRTERLVLPWSEVVDVHRYRGAYLVAKQGGAMPLPYRCFSAEQRERFERCVASRG